MSSVGNADTTLASDTLTIMAGASVAPIASAAPAFRLEAARPNPFRPATELVFSLAAEGEARLDVYDVRGARVSTLVSGRQAAGEHRAVWDGRGRDGAALPPGVYFARLEADGKVLSCKMLLAR